ncbi:hypothetical protein Poly30_33610 [Planctomycetes bacterium Poly30]|uniref:WD40-like Beta Propeller Repeat protein n=1 Tax=Saltatorellus ferox TaxID=2528018 RepID=A0A518EUV1_9BACT|nr:hypothetical protein Poly30_33610 [Planctomycetes bacterium Poly30]
MKLLTPFLEISSTLTRRRAAALAILAWLSASGSSTASAAPPRQCPVATTERVSVDSTGIPGSGGSGFGPGREIAVSDSGRFIAFSSDANNLVPGDVNGSPDVFVRDVVHGTTWLVSRTAQGAPGNGASTWPSMDENGLAVTFQSTASDLVPGDTNGLQDIFLYCRSTGSVSLVSQGTNGALSNGTSETPDLSADAANVVSVPGSSTDVYLRDRSVGTRAAGGTYCLSSVNSSGAMAETNIGGNNRIAAQSLVLQTEFLPPHSLRYYLFGETVGNVPGFGGSAGRLCLGGQIFRLTSFVQTAGLGGTVVQPMPFGSLPAAASLDVGETWHFQYWYRDSQGGAVDLEYVLGRSRSTSRFTAVHFSRR